jgi:hypothetical protein
VNIDKIRKNFLSSDETNQRVEQVLSLILAGSRKFQAGLPKSRASTHCLKSSYTLMQDYNHWP